MRYRRSHFPQNDPKSGLFFNFFVKLLPLLAQRDKRMPGESIFPVFSGGKLIKLDIIQIHVEMWLNFKNMYLNLIGFHNFGQKEPRK